MKTYLIIVDLIVWLNNLIFLYNLKMKKHTVFLTGLLFLIGMFSLSIMSAQSNEINAETDNTMNQDDVFIDSIKRLNPETLFDAAPYGFSQVVIPPEGTTVYLAGQGAIDVNQSVVGNNLEEQLPVVFENLRLALESVDAKPGNVVKIQTFIVDYKPEHLEPYINELIKFFGKNLPADTLVSVPRLALDGMLIEIDATAVIPNK